LTQGTKYFPALIQHVVYDNAAYYMYSSKVMDAKRVEKKEKRER